jgi:Uncharacterised nucleotidyltransferase
MTVTNPTGGCWPTELQELLLKACLLDGNQALQAWRLWEASTSLDSLDPGSYRLLPLLFTRLSRLGVQHPLMAQLKAIHRRAWSETRVRTWKVARAVRLLEEHGITTMVLKGVPLGVLFYPHVALRPMQDLDVLVPEHLAPVALDLLQANGWVRSGAHWPRESHRCSRIRNLLANVEEQWLLQIQPSINLVDCERREIDLHWNLLRTASFPGADKSFWDSAIPFTFEGIETRTLCATDHLLHACAHGITWNKIPPVRWVADSAMIVRTASIDWDRLVMLTDRLHAALPVSDGLHYLASLLDLRVPPEVLKRLARLKVSRMERLDYNRMQSEPRSGPVEWARSRYLIYSRSTRDRGILFRIRLMRRQSLLSLSRLVLPRPRGPGAVVKSQ